MKTIYRITSGSPHEIHRAGFILPVPDRIIKNGYIRIMNGRILEVGSHPRPFTRLLHGCRVKLIDHGPGVIIPPLVNAHTHFELSALSGRIPFNKGFGGWVRKLLMQREACGVDQLMQGASKGIEESLATGTALAGEISTLGITREIMQESKLSGVHFQEYLGEGDVDPNLSAKLGFMGNIGFSFAGHAPHTTAPDILKNLKAACLKHGLPFSIHAAESSDETEFITSARGNWADFLNERGIDFSSWPIPSPSPVRYLHDMGILDSHTLVVHLIDADKNDLDMLASVGAVPVLCARSNKNLHDRLPDLPGIAAHGSGVLKPALGTDSLASTSTLNMFHEMAFIAKEFPAIRPEYILTMATINGADALGFGDSFGTLKKGRKAAFLYLPHPHDPGPKKTREDIILEIINHYGES
ncbi:MAG: amidohydrolase family protein [Desulfamplus sp.]|nr:amidohydrolase family protein [Desulfamplus sp.]